jgi:dCTP deaminase
MSFWNTEELSRRQALKKIVEPFDKGRVKHGGYELSLGAEAFLTSGKGAKQRLKPDEQLVIPPGQFGLLLTEETLTVPEDAIAFISIRFGIKQRGLINVSGFHVDPGFSGLLKFAVYNAGSQNIVLSRGQRVFIIWFSDLKDPTQDGYDGVHGNQNNITSEDVMQLQGEVASPAVLKKRVDALRREVRILQSLALGILIVVVGIWAKPCSESKQAASNIQGSSDSNVHDGTNRSPSPNLDTNNEAASNNQSGNANHSSQKRPRNQ